MNTTNPRNRMHVLVIALAIFVFFIFSACDEQPVCTNACGITSPVTEVENAVMDAITVNQDNTLSGGN